nr:hypothetical protein GCM10020093_069040 [Planobispora longispora]
MALLRESGAVPPDHDPLVAAWLTAPSVAGDPLTPVLLPRVFDADGAGRALRDERLEPRPTRWLAAAARELPREQALDGCVSRFLRGGEAQDLRFFVRLHMLLDPTPAESAPRLRDYLRLLPSAPGTVAELAAEQVRRAMPLDHADLVEAVDALTFRDEAKFAARGLRWLDQAIRADPEVAADFVTALTTAYAHKSFDVRNRAVELTLKYAGLFADHTGAILDGVHHLPTGLGAKLAERFGGEVPIEELLERKEFPPLPEPPEARRFPEPSIFPYHHERWIDQERWLAAFVAGIADDRAELRRRLEPHVEQDRGYWRSREVRTDPDDWQSALSAELVTPGSVPELPPIGPEKFWDGANHSVGVRVLTRGEEPDPEPEPRGSRWSAATGPAATSTTTPAARLLHHLDQRRRPGRGGGLRGRPADPLRRRPDPPERLPADAEQPSSYGGDGEKNEDEDGWDDELPHRPHRLRTRPGVLYDDSVEAMPFFVLERAYERMAELGVAPARIAAMRAGKQVPPPDPDEPLVQVTVVFVPPRLRSFMPRELPEHDEWRRRNRLPHPNRVSPPHDFLLHRYAELAEALRDGTLPPVLLATPTWMSGHLDPDVLVDRLETCAAAGVEPPRPTWRRRCCGCPGAATGPRPTGPPRSPRRRRARPPAGSPATAWPTPSAATCGATWSARPWSSSATANRSTSPRSGCSRCCG